MSKPLRWLAIAFFAGIYLAQFHPTLTPHYPWQQAHSRTKRLERLLEDLPPASLGDQRAEINLWLAGQPPADPRLNDWLGEVPEVDPWGHPYQCVLRPAQPDESASSLGVYSRGEDGLTASQGNDPDDLNSWNPDSTRQYQRESTLRLWLVWLGQGLLLTPFIYLGFYVIARVCSPPD